MRKKITAGILALCLAAALSSGAAAVTTSASSAILVELESGRVLYAQNADEERLIASITKLMTALIAAEMLTDLGEVIRVRQEWLGSEGSSIYLMAGEEITVEALLYGLLLESGNDAAMVLACRCAGSGEEFARLMNGKAAELGMEHSSFQNPSGLNAEGHYSTARDMAALARACLKNETVARICATRTAVFGKRVFVNHNRLLTLCEGCVGMKTGYTQKAGRTLVSAAEREGMTLIAVTLNDPNDWKDHMTLLDYGFARFSAESLCGAGDGVTALPVTGSLCRTVPLAAAETVCYPLTEGEVLRAEVTVPARLSAPVKAGEAVGRLTWYLGEEAVAETELAAACDVRVDAVGEATLLQKILSAILGETITVLSPIQAHE